MKGCMSNFGFVVSTGILGDKPAPISQVFPLSGSLKAQIAADSPSLVTAPHWRRRCPPPEWTPAR